MNRAVAFQKKSSLMKTLIGVSHQSHKMETSLPHRNVLEIKIQLGFLNLTQHKKVSMFSSTMFTKESCLDMSAVKRS